jgi:hypothetical protein
MNESLNKQEVAFERKLKDFGEDWSSKYKAPESSMSLESTSQL